MTVHIIRWTFAYSTTLLLGRRRSDAPDGRKLTEGASANCAPSLTWTRDRILLNPNSNCCVKFIDRTQVMCLCEQTLERMLLSNIFFGDAICWENSSLDVGWWQMRCAARNPIIGDIFSFHLLVSPLLYHLFVLAARILFGFSSIIDRPSEPSSGPT